MIDQHTLDYIYKIQDERDWWRWYSMIQGIWIVLVMTFCSVLMRLKTKGGVE